MPCFASGYVLSDEAQYLTNQGVQGKALKGMLERVIEAKDADIYDLDAANINTYNWFTYYFIENPWIFITNFEDYGRGLLFWFYEFFYGEE